MPTSGFPLGVDFGTSNTVAVLRSPDGRARSLLVDGSPLLPSAVYADPGGNLLVGRDAIHSARLDPARFEPNPKRGIDDHSVLLGDRELPVVDLVAAGLIRIAEEARRTTGGATPDPVTMTCPAGWGPTRRGLLCAAAALAGWPRVRLVEEPVAAATYFTNVLGRQVPVGSVVVVHDFGAGTFDVSVVAKTADGFDVLAVDGRDDIGGLDIDAAIVTHLGRLYGTTPEWQRLTRPANTVLCERVVAAPVSAPPPGAAPTSGGPLPVSVPPGPSPTSGPPARPVSSPPVARPVSPPPPPPARSIPPATVRVPQPTMVASRPVPLPPAAQPRPAATYGGRPNVLLRALRL